MPTRKAPQQKQAPRPQRKRLGFYLEWRAECWVLQWYGNGCRPATDPEIEMWHRLKGLEEAAALLAAEAEAAEMALRERGVAPRARLRVGLRSAVRKVRKAMP